MAIKKALFTQASLSCLHNSINAKLECAIVSNKHTDSITKSLQEFGLTHYFTNIYGSDGTHPPKPNAEIFTLDIHPSRPQLALSDFLMVGDTETDYWFAHHAGIDIAWVDYGYGNPDFAQQHPINYRLKTPIDLLKFV